MSFLRLRRSRSLKVFIQLLLRMSPLTSSSYHILIDRTPELVYSKCPGLSTAVVEETITPPLLLLLRPRNLNLHLLLQHGLLPLLPLGPLLPPELNLLQLGLHLSSLLPLLPQPLPRPLLPPLDLLLLLTLIQPRPQLRRIHS
jgi:hypothetical protein